MFIVKNFKFDHIGTSSTDNKYKDEIKINRNWHFSWSKFYYYKKNYNYFYALKKILPNIFQSIIGIVFNDAMQRIVRAFERRASNLYD